VDAEFWAAQVVGVGAAMLGISAYQLRGDKSLIYSLAGAAGLMVGSLLWMVFNVKVGSIPGTVVMAAEAISNGLFIWKALKNRV